jgi:hypothetical protein
MNTEKMYSEARKDLEEINAINRHIKRCVRAFGQQGYTPLIARRLASIFVNLHHKPKDHQEGVIGLIERIVREGKSK